MFNIITEAQCDLCKNKYVAAAQPFTMNQPIRIKVPPDWNLMSSSINDKEIKKLICSSHNEVTLGVVLSHPVDVDAPLPIEPPSLKH